MKTHILLTLLTLVISACASNRRDVASSPNEERLLQEKAQHAQMIDGAASRIR